MGYIRKIIPYLLLTVFLVLSILFGIYDLKISENIVNYSSKIGIIFEQYGELISPFFALLSSIILSISTNYKPHNKIILILIASLLTIYFLFQSIFIAIPIILFVILVLQKPNSEIMLFVSKVALFTLIYFFVLLFLTTVIKYLWGRVRFRDLINIEQFTPFYLPQGITGNYSFPSGHTSSIMIVYVLSFFSCKVKNTFIKTLFYIIPILIIILMAVSRVIIGAHYSSDVLYSMIIGSASFYILNKIFIKKELW